MTPIRYSADKEKALDILTTSGVTIGGIVACLPQNILDNRTACAELYGDGVETLIKATGIEGRAIVDRGTTALDLCTVAAHELLQETGTSPEEIGAVICVTFTPEHIMPADAPAAQARLGLPNECMAFDVNMACSGYGYGMYLASTICKQLGKKVLLLDGDAQTAYVSQRDKATMPVMGDVGTATLLEPRDGAASWNYSFYTDGSKREALYIPAGGSKRRVTPDDIQPKAYDDGSERSDIDIYMDGFGIFKFVAVTASRFIKSYMAEREIAPEDIDIFVPHQANIYMISQLAKKLGIPEEKMWKSGDVYGNPASASVPLTIAANAREWFSAGGGVHTLFAGFGGGLSISVADVDLNADGYYGLVRYENEDGE